MNTEKIIGREPRTGRVVELSIDAGTIVRIDESVVETDLYISPGFIDLQVNGYAGIDLNASNLTVDMVTGLVESMLARGVTCVIPTLITAPEADLCARLKVMAAAHAEQPIVAASVPFVHMEGPHISALDGYRGAHDAEFVRPPEISEFDRWQKAADGIVGMVTLSPHFSNAEAYIRALVDHGVIVAIGHTHASTEQIKRAVDAGARLSTHLGNGIAQTIQRHNNPIWAQLADERLTATFIADGNHLPKEVIQAMVRAKGIERSVLVSDSVALAGMPPGNYFTPVGGRVELKQDGRLCLAGTDLLAGSTASLPQCIGYLVREAGITLGDAITMATENPGRFAGGRGRMLVGARADLVRFRWSGEISIEDVWLGGERVQLKHA